MGCAPGITLAALVTAILAARGNAGAESALPFELEWEAPPGCPDGAAVEKDVARRLGESSAAKRPLRAHARVHQPSENVWVLELETVQEGTVGSRRIEGRTCEALTEAATAIFALAIDPDLAAASDPITASEAKPRTATVAPLPSRAPVRRAVSSPVARGPTGRAEPVSAFAVFEEGALFGIFAPARPVVGAGFGFELGPATLSLFGDYAFKQTTTAEDREAGVSLSLVYARISGCHAAFRSDSWSLASCVGVGSVRASGIGTGAHVTDPRSNWLMWPHAELGGVLSGRIRGPLRLRLDAAALVPLDRPAVRLDGIGVVTRPYYVGGRLSAGLAVTL